MYNADVCIKGEIVEIQVAGKVAYNKIATPNGIDYLSKLLSRVSGSTFRAKVLIKGEGRAVDKRFGGKSGYVWRQNRHSIT